MTSWIGLLLMKDFVYSSSKLVAFYNYCYLLSEWMFFHRRLLERWREKSTRKIVHNSLKIYNLALWVFLFICSITEYSFKYFYLSSCEGEKLSSIQHFIHNFSDWNSSKWIFIYYFSIASTEVNMFVFVLKDALKNIEWRFLCTRNKYKLKSNSNKKAETQQRRRNWNKWFWIF